MSKTTLYRSVNERERYYKIELIPNLFGEWLVIRTYGSLQRAKAAGTILELHPDPLSAQSAIAAITAQKKKRGYSPRQSTI